MYFTLLSSNCDFDTLIFTMTFFLNFIYLFLERGEGREKEKERNNHVREKPQSVSPHEVLGWAG